jgi:hypothetical protein
MAVRMHPGAPRWRSRRAGPGAEDRQSSHTPGRAARTSVCRFRGRDSWGVSKLCSHCGTLAESMPLHVRIWTCGCGTTHDRDVNAAKNLLAAGLAATKQKPSQREP